MDQIEPTIAPTKDELTAGRNVSNGDTFDEDANTYLGQITEADDSMLKAPPVNISVFLNGYFYVYKMERRYEQEQESTEETKVEVSGNISDEEARNL